MELLGNNKKIFYKHTQKEMREEPKWYPSKIKHKGKYTWIKWGEKAIKKIQKVVAKWHKYFLPHQKLHVCGLNSKSNKEICTIDFFLNPIVQLLTCVLYKRLTLDPKTKIAWNWKDGIRCYIWIITKSEWSCYSNIRQNRPKLLNKNYYRGWKDFIL